LITVQLASSLFNVNLCGSVIFLSFCWLGDELLEFIWVNASGV